jgi:hypothetical protein
MTTKSHKQITLRLQATTPARQTADESLILKASAEVASSRSQQFGRALKGSSRQKITRQYVCSVF